MSILADILRLPSETLELSYLYFNRYKHHVALKATPDPLDAHTLALTSLSLATKTTEAPRRLRELLLPAHRLLHNHSQGRSLTIPSPTYDALRASLVRAELLHLRTLKFELRAPLPLASAFLPRYLSRALALLSSTSVSGEGEGTDYDDLDPEQAAEDRILPLSDTALARACEAAVARAYASFALANFFPARAVAAACLLAELRRRRVGVGGVGGVGGGGEEVERWLSHVTDGRVEGEDVDEILAELEALPP
ncbi:MAG: hypothetical protein M1832_001640 [Thelocarpon impressellum]|nr:MAG: hypothetical protein M1832_001640 [Thelocarpon impressellum]